MPAAAAPFLAMHQVSPGFIIPNAWDAGSARLLELAGFPAIATTSAGISFARARPDGSLTRDEMLDAISSIVAAVACPVSGDLEAGYGATPDDVANTIALAMSIGLAGVNIEDAMAGVQFDAQVAGERVAAARSAAPAGELVINARIDSFLLDRTTTPVEQLLDDTIVRASRYIAAGADCIFVPGVDDPPLIESLVNAIDAPVNVVVGLTSRLNDAATLRQLGVARISVGGSLARAAFAVVRRAATDMLIRERFDFAASAVPHADLQRAFAPPA